MFFFPVLPCLLPEMLLCNYFSESGLDFLLLVFSSVPMEAQPCCSILSNRGRENIDT